MSIKVSNVSKLYGSQKALNDVSFEVSSSEVIGFLGPNGAGKSTMMKIITCFLPQTEGNINVCGFDVNLQAMEVKKCVGYLPEHNPLYLDMYVKEYLGFVAGLHGIKHNVEKRVAEMVDITGLQIEQSKKIAALSKGYRQRVGLAQALIHNPKVLILDEPTSGLDPNQLTEIRALIKNIGKEKTVVLSTHIMQEVEAVCDRVIIINKGEIVANEQTSMIQTLIKSENIVDVEFDKETTKDSLRTIASVTKVTHLKGNTWRIYAEESADIRATIFNYAVHHQLAVLMLQKHEQTLEEIFQKLTTKA